MILYTDEFLDDLPREPKVGLHAICLKFLQTSQGSLNVALEFYALAETYVSANSLDILLPTLSVDRKENAEVIYQFAVQLCKKLERYVGHNEDQIKLDRFRNKFSSKIASGFVYEFSQGDLERLKKLLKKASKILLSSDFFEGSYKNRMIKRLEILLLELTKKQSDIDRFWGLAAETGVVISKYGNNAKPIVEIIKEIINLVWVTQARAEDLSSDSVAPVFISGDWL